MPFYIGDPSKLVAGSITIEDGVLTFTPTAEFEDNQIYTVVIRKDLEDEDGNVLPQDYVYMFATSFSPLYASVEDVMRLIQEFASLLSLSMASATELIYIASLDVNYILKVTDDLVDDEITHPVRQFVTYRAARNLLLRGYMAHVGATSGDRIQIADLTVAESARLAQDITILLKNLADLEKMWEDELRGFGDRGYAKPEFAEKANQTVPEGTPRQYSQAILR